MKSDKLFKSIWNINGLLIFIGIVISILFIAFQILSNIFDTSNNEQPVLNLAQDEKQEEKWSLGYPQKIGQTDIYYIPLESEKLSIEKKRIAEYDFSSNARYTKTRSKNVLLINSTTNNSTWLFDSTDQLVININPLISNEYKEIAKSHGMSYEVINSDSNGDNTLDDTDKRTFAISKIDGSNYSEIISGYNQIVTSSINSEGNLFVVYINNNEVYSMLVDMNTFNVIMKDALPRVGSS